MRLNIVCFGSEPWLGLWQRHQHIMTGLADMGHNIVYVDYTNLMYEVLRLGITIKRMEQVNEKIIVTRPLFLPFHYRLDVMETIDTDRTFRLLNRALKKFKVEKPDVIWTYSPYFNFVIDMWPDAVLVYDCVDACDGTFSCLLSNGSAKKWMQVREKELIARADAVVAVSKALHDRCVPYNSNTYYISNGASFSPSVNGPAEELPSFKGPVIGYVGSLGDWVDYGLLLDLAESRPSCSIVLVGPTHTKDPRLQKLSKMDNVFMPGKKEYAQIPDYIAMFDVCLIPFAVHDLTRMANPVKFFEYAAQGKPIVSTPLDGVLEHADLVYSSDGTSEGFIEQVDKALKETDKELRERRIALAREHDWKHITLKIDGILQDLMAARTSR